MYHVAGKFGHLAYEGSWRGKQIADSVARARGSSAGHGARITTIGGVKIWRHLNKITNLQNINYCQKFPLFGISHISLSIRTLQLQLALVLTPACGGATYTQNVMKCVLAYM